MRLDLKRDLLTLPTKDIYYKYLLGQEVWYFEKYLSVQNPSKQYDEFKKYISQGLDVHFNNVAIIGSAKTGFSFSPKKKLKAFSEESDVDIVLVSQKHFQRFWDAYSDMYYNQTLLPEYHSVAKSVFKRFISLKAPTEKHPEIKKWIKTVDPFLKDLQLFFGIEHGVNYRIYESWESVEKYHFHGIKQLKNYAYNVSVKEKQVSLIVSSLAKYQERELSKILTSLINHKNGNNK